MSLLEMLFGTQLTEILQGLLSPQFDLLFLATTLLGDGIVLVGLSAATYWCFDKSRGRVITYVLLLGAYLNFFLKIFVAWPRPPIELRIAEKSETSYGFPSGHAQDSMTFWSWTAVEFRKRIVSIMGVLIVVAVGISRIYLGLHYPVQVIGGWIVGLAVACSGMLILRRFPQIGQVRAMPQMLFAFSALIPMMIAVALNIVGDTYPAKVGGYIFGFSVGALVEERFVHFTNKASASQKIMRLGTGGALTGLLALGTEIILPSSYLVPSFVNSTIRGLFVAAIIPALFTRIERHYA